MRSTPGSGLCARPRRLPMNLAHCLLPGGSNGTAAAAWCPASTIPDTGGRNCKTPSERLSGRASLSLGTGSGGEVIPRPRFPISSSREAFLTREVRNIRKTTPRSRGVRTATTICASGTATASRLTSRSGATSPWGTVKLSTRRSEPRRSGTMRGVPTSWASTSSMRTRTSRSPGSSQSPRRT